MLFNQSVDESIYESMNHRLLANICIYVYICMDICIYMLYNDMEYIYIYIYKYIYIYNIYIYIYICIC